MWNIGGLTNTLDRNGPTEVRALSTGFRLCGPMDDNVPTVESKKIGALYRQKKRMKWALQCDNDAARVGSSLVLRRKVQEIWAAVRGQRQGGVQRGQGLHHTGPGEAGQVWGADKHEVL